MINNDLRKYIEEHIFSLNNKNDIGHNMEHVLYVIKRSLKFAEEVDNIDINMVYVIASYHDVGHHIDAKNHEKVSSEIFLNDVEMKKYFNEEERIIISEAILDHRASGNNEPRSVYGKIVSSADRNTSLDEPLMRTHQYTLKHCPGLSIDEMTDRAMKHLIDKYGREGYALEKMYFKDEDYVNYLEELWELLDNYDLFRDRYLSVNDLK